jgi:hypothetical protein
LATAAVRVWIDKEHQHAMALLDATDRRLGALKRQSGLSALWIFARSIRRFSRRRLPRIFPFLREPAKN